MIDDQEEVDLDHMGKRSRWKLQVLLTIYNWIRWHTCFEQTFQAILEDKYKSCNTNTRKMSDPSVLCLNSPPCLMSSSPQLYRFAAVEGGGREWEEFFVCFLLGMEGLSFSGIHLDFFWMPSKLLKTTLENNFSHGKQRNYFYLLFAAARVDSGKGEGLLILLLLFASFVQSYLVIGKVLCLCFLWLTYLAMCIYFPCGKETV